MSSTVDEWLQAAEYILAHSPIELTPVEIVHELLAGVVASVAEHVPWRPGARELLASLVDHAVPCALVTMSWESLAMAVVSNLPKGSFAAVVTGDVVQHGKPHPEPYLAAARLLGVDLGACIAIEDSPNGVRAAKAAGLACVAVPNELTRLLDLTEKAAHAEGRLEGIAAEKVRVAEASE